jgi:DNA-binding transcriptional regulator YhcF (GntR family)
MASNLDQQSYIVIEEERLKERFTQVPNTILRRKDVSPGAKLAYMVILSYAWQEESCFPGQQRLAEDIGVTPRSVITYLKELQSAGLLRVKRRGLGMTNVYYISRWEEPRSENFSHQEVKETTVLEVKNLQTKNTQGTKTQTTNTQTSNNLEQSTTHKHQEKASFSKKAQVRNFENQGLEEEKTQDDPDNDRGEYYPIKPSKDGPSSVGQILKAKNLPLTRPEKAREPSYTPRAGSEDGTGARQAQGRVRKGRSAKLEAPAWLESTIKDLSYALHDPSKVDSNISQATRLFYATGGERDRFWDKLNEAKREAQKRMITKPSDDDPGTINRVPYLFKVLRDLLGLKDVSQEEITRRAQRIFCQNLPCD